VVQRDTDTAIGGPDGRFPSTQISLLEAAAGGLSDAALDRVIAMYWKPVYRFIRLKFRKSNEDAKDLTQSFFAGAIERELLARFDPSKAPFRSYLRMAVERFAANEYAAENRQKRGGGVAFEPVDEQSVTAAAESPEQLFEREWQRQLFGLALDDLRALCDASGKQVQFRIFAAYDLAEGDRPSYASLAVEHGVTEATVTNHLSWARRTLRALATDRMRGVTPDEGELRDEMRRLWI
jgi:RNA polymerase sigma-70 factor (ECF subfamily)